MPGDTSVIAGGRGIASASGTNSKRIRIKPPVRVGGRDRRNPLNRVSDRFIPAFQGSSALGMEPPLATRVLAMGRRVAREQSHSCGGRGTVRRVTVGGVAACRRSPRCAVSPCLAVLAQSSTAARADLGAVGFQRAWREQFQHRPRDLASGAHSISRARVPMRQQMRGPFRAACLGARSGV
jgi:hypothetical protein